MSISDRELYKKLKKHKVFSKFCMCCAQVFTNGVLSYNQFLEESAKPTILEDEQHFARDIKNWLMCPPYVRIMQKQE